ncbi:MAG TPA: hypothetical protein DCE33_14945 [Rhodospirillaceae bacterium]|nr:hypothetical protein [Rhodospirillaceae bacterium]
MRAIEIADLDSRLAADNPWWEAGADVIQTSGFRQRACLAKAQARSANGLPTLITGPRRSGKSILLRQIAADALTNGTEPHDLLILRGDSLLNDDTFFSTTIERFMTNRGSETTPRPVLLIDDIHCLPEWEILLEETSHRYPTARVTATSAAPPILAPPSFERIHMPPVTFFEFMQFREAADGAQIRFDDEQNAIAVASMAQINQAFVEYLNFGGMPEAAFSGHRSLDAIYPGRQAYLDGVLRQYLPILFGINNPQELQRIFQILAHNSGEEISIEHLAELGGVAKNTIRKYLDFLGATYQLQRLDKFDPMTGPYARARKFKLYLTDPSAHAALFGPVGEGAEATRLVESAILAAALLRPAGTELYYGLWKRREVPFIALTGPSRNKSRAYFYLDWAATEETQLDGYARLANFPPEALGPEPYVEIFTQSLSAATEFDGVEVRFTPAALYCWEMGRQAALDWPVF